MNTKIRSSNNFWAVDKICTSSIGVLSSLTLIAGIALIASPTYAQSCTTNNGETTCTDSARASVTVAEACSMTATLDVAHTATIPGGVYAGGDTSEYYPGGIGQTTLKVTCNDSNGYSLYAVGYTGDKIGDTNSTKLVGTNGTISTGTATSGDTSNWAMRLATSGSSYQATLENGYGTYSSIPATYTKVASYASSTDAGTNATGSTLTTTYAAYITRLQAAGTYIGKVKYTMVHPSDEEPASPQTATSGCINYFANASTAVGTMGCQTIGTSDTTKELLASNYSRAGYGFAGWSDAYDYATNPNAHFYGPQEQITFTAGQYTGSNNGLSLYAVWVKSAGSLQSDATTTCNSLTTAPTNGTAGLASVSALTDQRDNETYAIAKLADGKCWMIENLRLESTNSDNSTGLLAQGYGTSSTYGNFSGLADAESANFSDSTTANSLYYSGTQSSTASIDIGASNYPGYRMPRYNNWNNQPTSANRPQNPTANSATNSTTNAGMYSYGNYYTWHAAIADLTYNNTNNSSVTNTSLCPTGWRLPQGGNKTRIVSNDDNDFWNLTVDALNNSTNPANYDSSTTPYYTGSAEAGPVANKLKSFPNNFLYSGYFDTSSANNRGGYGNYWSSTAGNSSDSYRLYLGSSIVRPGTYDYVKSYGYSIRCIVGGGS